MKTAIQNAIKEIAELWSSPSDQPTYSQVFDILEAKLPEEKQNIINAHSKGQQYFNPGYNPDISEQYYNKTFNNGN